MFHDPLGAGLHVIAVLWLCRDAGEADVIAKFVNEARLVLFKVVNDGLHEIYVTLKVQSPKSKVQGRCQHIRRSCRCLMGLASFRRAGSRGSTAGETPAATLS